MPTSLSRRAVLSAAAGLPLLACKSRADHVAPPPQPSTSKLRNVVTVVPAVATLEGAGVHLARSLGGRAMPMLDPFLLLDEIRSHEPSEFTRGFPSHPHRGFETVTYMIDGAMEHADSLGNRGLLGPGDAQWMTAGRGIIHSEMPRDRSGGLWGLQLWVNLPAREKMRAPRYQDVERSRIPEISGAGHAVRVVAGRAFGEVGPVEGIATAPSFLDVTLGHDGAFEHELPLGHRAFVYLLSGDARVGASRTPITERTLAALGPGDGVVLQGRSGARALIVSAAPIEEPVARRGPFVMNTEEELQRAFEDYRAGRLTDG